MMLRSVPFDQVAKLMTAHFVARQIFTGAGRVGIGERSETAGYQLSQRADYFHMKVGLQTHSTGRSSILETNRTARMHTVDCM